MVFSGKLGVEFAVVIFDLNHILRQDTAFGLLGLGGNFEIVMPSDKFAISAWDKVGFAHAGFPHGVRLGFGGHPPRATVLAVATKRIWMLSRCVCSAVCGKVPASNFKAEEIIFKMAQVFLVVDRPNRVRK